MAVSRLKEIKKPSVLTGCFNCTGVLLQAIDRKTKPKPG
jgi:hypothetical protein